MADVFLAETEGPGQWWNLMRVKYTLIVTHAEKPVQM